MVVSSAHSRISGSVCKADTCPHLRERDGEVERRESKGGEKGREAREWSDGRMKRERGERGRMEGKRDRREWRERGGGWSERGPGREGGGWGREIERERERNFCSKIPANELRRINAKSLCHIC